MVTIMIRIIPVITPISSIVRIIIGIIWIPPTKSYTKAPTG